MDFQQIRDFVNPAVAQATGIEAVENLSMPVPVAYVPVQLVIDGALSLTSENPVQNKVIAVAIQQLDGRITAIEGQFSEGVTEAVNNWLAAHPEATTTVQDGAITYAKLDSNLKGEVDQISELKSALQDIKDLTIDTTTETTSVSLLTSVSGKYINTSTGAIDDVGVISILDSFKLIDKAVSFTFTAYQRLSGENQYAFYSADTFEECGSSTLVGTVKTYTPSVSNTVDVPKGAKIIVIRARQSVTGTSCTYKIESAKADNLIAELADEIATLSNDVANAVPKEDTVVSQRTLLFTDAVVKHSQKIIASDGTITDGTLTNQNVTEIKIPSGYDVLCFMAQERTDAENRFAIYNANSFEECGPSTLVLISKYKNEYTGEQNEIAITEETKIICILSRQSIGKCDVQKKQTINPADLNFAKPYDPLATYRGGEHCTKDGTVYKRKITDSYSPEEWDVSHWDAINYAVEHETEQDFTVFSDFVRGRIDSQTGGIISAYTSAISKDIFKVDRDIIVSISDGYWFELVVYGSYEESSIIRQINSGYGSNLTHIPAGTYMRAAIGETGRQSTETLQESEIKNIARKITFRSAYGDQQVKIENGQTAMYQSDTALMFQKGAAEKTLSKQPCILVAGQSNIDGRVPASSLPEEVAAAFPNVLIANSSTGAFSSIGQASGNQGIDRSMYKALNDSGNGNVYIIKKSMGATAISPYGSTKCWTPWYEELANISNSLLYSFDLLTKKCIAQSGSLFDIKAFLWQQGEGDYSTLTSGSRKAAFAYYRNFKALVAYVRGMANNPRLPIVCGTVSHLSGQYDPIVEAATLKVAEEDPYMTCIDMSGAGLLDTYHFNADAAVYFGYKAFDALIDFGVVTGTKINPTRPW